MGGRRRPGIRPGAPPLITRQEEVAPLVLAAAGCPAASRVNAQARTTPVPTAAPPTASLKVCAPIATMAAATAAATRTAKNASSSRTPPGTRRHGGLASSTAKMVASAKLLVACPLGKACPMASPMDGLSTYSVRPIAMGTAATVSTAPRHRRMIAHASISANVMTVTGFQLAEVGQPVQQHGKPAQVRLEPRVERRVEPARQPVAGDADPDHRHHRDAGRQQRHGRPAKRPWH